MLSQKGLDMWTERTTESGKTVHTKNWDVGELRILPCVYHNQITLTKANNGEVIQLMWELPQTIEQAKELADKWVNDEHRDSYLKMLDYEEAVCRESFDALANIARDRHLHIHGKGSKEKIDFVPYLAILAILVVFSVFLVWSN